MQMGGRVETRDQSPEWAAASMHTVNESHGEACACWCCKVPVKTMACPCSIKMIIARASLTHRLEVCEAKGDHMLAEEDAASHISRPATSRGALKMAVPLAPTTTLRRHAIFDLERDFIMLGRDEPVSASEQRKVKILYRAEFQCTVQSGGYLRSTT